MSIIQETYKQLTRRKGLAAMFEREAVNGYIEGALIGQLLHELRDQKTDDDISLVVVQRRNTGSYLTGSNDPPKAQVLGQATGIKS